MIFWRKDKDKAAAEAAPIVPPQAPAQPADREGETWVSRLGMGLGKSSIHELTRADILVPDGFTRTLGA